MSKHEYKFNLRPLTASTADIKQVTNWCDANVHEDDWDVDSMTASWSTGSTTILQAIKFSEREDAIAFGLRFGLKCDRSVQISDNPLNHR